MVHNAHVRSAPPKQGGGSASEPEQAHPGSAPRTIPKSEPTEEDTRVPREEARASREGKPHPPVWDNNDVFQGGRGVVEENGYIPEGESDNLNRRLNVIESMSSWRDKAGTN
eukprot:579149-Amphidinium_carterae.1